MAVQSESMFSRSAIVKVSNSCVEMDFDVTIFVAMIPPFW